MLAAQLANGHPSPPPPPAHELGFDETVLLHRNLLVHLAEEIPPSHPLNLGEDDASSGDRVQSPFRGSSPRRLLCLVLTCIAPRRWQSWAIMELISTSRSPALPIGPYQPCMGHHNRSRGSSSYRRGAEAELASSAMASGCHRTPVGGGFRALRCLAGLCPRGCRILLSHFPRGSRCLSRLRLEY